MPIATDNCGCRSGGAEAPSYWKTKPTARRSACWRRLRAACACKSSSRARSVCTGRDWSPSRNDW